MEPVLDYNRRTDVWIIAMNIFSGFYRVTVEHDMVLVCGIAFLTKVMNCWMYRFN